MPCVDVPHLKNLNKSELSVPVTDSNHKTTDHCSPFCTCDCCISNVIPADNTIRLKCMEYTFNEYKAYSASYVSSFFSSYWQPPKIG